MTWIKLDTRIRSHPKLQAISDRSWRYYVCSLCYAADYRTDGLIPNAVLSHVDPEAKRPRSTAEQLVSAGLFEQVDGGYQIHDYGDYQQSSEQIRADENGASRAQAPARAHTAAPARTRSRGRARAQARPPEDVDVDRETPPDPPTGGRATDRDSYEAELGEFTRRHFPGVPPKAVAHYASLLRARRIEPTLEALRPLITSNQEILQ